MTQAPTKNDLEQIRNDALANSATRAARKAENQKRAKRIPPPDPNKWRGVLRALIAQGTTDIGVGYWRQSDVIQTDGFGSEAQIRHVVAWTRARAGDGLDTISDRGIDLWLYDVDSGKEETRVGTEFVREIIKDPEFRNYIKIIVVPKFDRFARNQYYSELLHRELKDARIPIFSAQENLPKGALGDFFRQIIQALAQYESAMIASRLLGGRREAIRQNGVFHGAEAPYGYRTVGNRWESGHGRIEVCEAEAKVVRLIFDLRYKRYSTVQIAEYLRRNGIPTRHNGKVGWTPTQIYNVLNHEKAYRGEALFHTTVTDFKTIAHTAIMPTRPLDERGFSARHDIVSLRSRSVPDDIETKPEIRPNPLSVDESMTADYAHTMAYALQLADAGYSRKQIAEALTEKKRPRWRGGTAWTEVGVRHLLAPNRRASLVAAVSRFVDVTVPVVFETNIKAADAEVSEMDARMIGRDLAAEMAAVNRIHELRATGAAYREIAERLLQEGHRTANGVHWCASSVGRVITGVRKSAKVTK